MFIKELKKNGHYTVTFRIPCEELPEDIVASQINIVASFNNWSISETPMKVADGIGWEATVKLKPGQYEFRYLINDYYWYNDWSADGYESNRLQNADNCLLILDKPKKEKKGKSKKSKKDDKKKGKAAPKATKKPEKKSKKSEPKPQETPKPKAADDLKKLEGIGPKISSVLAEAGVTTFAQVAEMSVDQIREILTGKVRIFHPTSWPEQAALAAAGDWEGLQTLQDSLIGGRKA